MLLDVFQETLGDAAYIGCILGTDANPDKMNS